MFQAEVTAAVAAAMTLINASSDNGAGSGTNNFNQGNSQGHPREFTYKNFMNCKPKSFSASRGWGVIALMQ